MQLMVNGTSLSITHMGPNFLIRQSPHASPPCEATIVRQIDGNERRWQVRLPVPEGIHPGREFVLIAKC